MVEFTQFLRPNGRQIPVRIDLPPHVEEKAKLIQKQGFRFEIEVLINDLVSATIADPVQEEDLAFAKIVPNGPQVPTAIIDMIMKFEV